MNCRPAALAKLSAPRIFAALARERLFALLDRGLKQTSVWVSGPPGSGKSTLAASYLESRRIAGLWYQIDGGDSDPASFFHYLRFAVDRSRRRKSPALPLFTPDHLRDLSGFARRYFRDLFSRLPVDSVLVLDNYQEAALSSDLHKVVSIALEEMPAGIGLIVLSREGPPPEFARWLAGERIYLLNWDALQLTLDETRRIAGSRIEVDEQSIEALHRQCAGWAGGLTLMLDEIRRSGTFESLHHMETFGTLFDYFAHQVFSAAPQRLRDFLVRTAALPRMTPDTAREISGQAEAARALDDLYRRRLFTDRRMGSPPTYQYHTLFRGFLSARAVDMLGADEWARTTRHAGQLLEEHGLLDDAVDVYRSIQDWEGVVRIIRSCAPTLLTQGQAKMLSHWIEYLPRSRLQADAWLPYWHGMAMLTVHPGRARESLEQAYALFEPSDHVEGQLRSTSGIIQARFLETVDHRTIDPWLEVSARLLMVADGTCPADVRLRAHSAMMIGALYRQPGNPALNASVQQVLALLESDADTNDKLAAAGFLLVYTGYTGDIKTAARIIPIGTLLAEAPDATPMNRGMWFSWLGYNHLYSLEPESAGRALDRAARIGEHENLRSVAFIADYFQGMLKRSLHQYDQAREHLKAMRAICDERSLVQTAICHALAGWLAVLPEGNLDQAIEHGRSAWTIARQLGSPSYLVHWGTPLIFGLIERGEIEEGLALLNEQRAALAGTAIRCYDPVFLCVDATVAARRGDECSALELTARMFSLAKSAGHGAYLTRLSPWMPALCSLALRHGVEVDYVSWLIRRIGWPPDTQSAIHWPWRCKVLTLGKFEVLSADNPLKFGRKTPRRPLALLRALTAVGPAGAPFYALTDHLWSDQEADRARHSLETAVHRLRRMLGEPGLVRIKDNRVSLDATSLWVDAWAFEEMASAENGSPRSSTDGGFQHAITLYRGAFLPDDDTPWVLSTRDRLRAKFIAGIEAQGKGLEEAAELSQALDCYRRGLAADDTAEAFYQGLMRCHARLGQRTEGILAYRHLRERLTLAHGTAPSRESERLHQAFSVP